MIQTGLSGCYYVCKFYGGMDAGSRSRQHIYTIQDAMLLKGKDHADVVTSGVQILHDTVSTSCITCQ